MKILFIHQNFPGQFKFLAPALAAQGHQVVALTMQAQVPAGLQGVTVVKYNAARGSTPNIHPWVGDFETKVIRGQACFEACRRLKQQGFTPDVVVAHPGWGESLFLKDVWPQTRLGMYCEFFYSAEGSDMGFDPEFAKDSHDDVCRIRIKNLNNLLHFQAADAGLSPTHWQASTFPQPFRSRISVIHDGIDTKAMAPSASVTLQLRTGADALQLSRDDEIVTFVNRNLEPYRGYHTFMRSLPLLLRQRPKARVLLVGGDDVSYGSRPAQGTWKQRYIDEVQPLMSASEWSRVHFLGRIPYAQFLSLLQLSTVHVYLTYPFVLSWSLLEAMSVGCAIVGSRTPPLEEAIVHGHTGRLTDFFDATALAQEVIDLLEQPEERQRLGAQARVFAQEHYDLHRVCLPQQLKWVEALAA